MGMGDWLGTGVVASHKRSFENFKETRKFACSLNLRNNLEWRAYAKLGKLPPDIPATPDAVYKNKGWSGWKNWLGNYQVTE